MSLNVPAPVRAFFKQTGALIKPAEPWTQLPDHQPVPTFVEWEGAILLIDRPHRVSEIRLVHTRPI